MLLQNMNSFACRGPTIYFARLNLINNQQINQQSIKLNDKGKQTVDPSAQQKKLYGSYPQNQSLHCFGLSWSRQCCWQLLVVAVCSEVRSIFANLVWRRTKDSPCFLVLHSMKAADTLEIVEEQGWRFRITGFDQSEAALFISFIPHHRYSSKCISNFLQSVDLMLWESNDYTLNRQFLQHTLCVSKFLFILDKVGQEHGTHGIVHQLLDNLIIGSFLLRASTPDTSTHSTR